MSVFILEIERHLNKFSTLQLTSDWTEVEIIHLPNTPGFGLGFGIVGGTSSGVVVKTILSGSVAHKVCLEQEGNVKK